MKTKVPECTHCDPSDHTIHASQSDAAIPTGLTLEKFMKGGDSSSDYMTVTIDSGMMNTVATYTFDYKATMADGEVYSTGGPFKINVVCGTTSGDVVWGSFAAGKGAHQYVLANDASTQYIVRQISSSNEITCPLAEVELYNLSPSGLTISGSTNSDGHYTLSVDSPSVEGTYQFKIRSKL